MMILRSEQIQALSKSEGLLERFIERARLHLITELPEHWAEILPDAARAKIAEEIVQAHQLGFQTEGQVIRFMEVRSLWGPDFGDIERHRLALKLLFDSITVQNWPANRAFVVATKELPE